MPPTTHPDFSVALDALLAALDMETIGDGRFGAEPDTVRPLGRVYGGQLLAQALMAAGRTVREKAPMSMHAAFVRAGMPGRRVEAAVEVVRDGRSMATRQVTVSEETRALLTATVTFRSGEGGAEVAAAAPPVPPPEEMPLLQDWAGRLPPHLADHGTHWIEHPPPVEMRLPSAPCFMGGHISGPTRSHWMRAPRDLGDSALLNAALLAYASDFFLMDMVFHAYPAPGGPGRSNGLSLDHAIWFHRPVRFHRWHLHTQECLSVVGERGLARGTIHSDDGHLVATVMQEVLILPEPIR